MKYSNSRGIALVVSGWKSLLVVWLSGVLTTQAQILNDGTTTAGLARLSNQNEAGPAQVFLRPGNGVLLMVQSNVVDNLPLRTAWYSASQAPAAGTYSVWADFKPSENTARNRGGVIGWLNLGTRNGITLKIVPGDLSYFDVAVVQFDAFDADTNEGYARLYNLDGTAATEAVTSARSDAMNYDPARPATFQLEFSPPSAAERQLTNVTATAHVTARVWQAGTAGGSNLVSRTIELLTDLPLPEQHRVGYFAYLGSIFVDGPVGELDNLTASGALTAVPNQPPTVTLTAPTNTTFTAPVDIEVAATASDPDGEIVSVRFQAGGTVLGTVTTPPYSLIWSNVPPGNYALRAFALDSRGETRSSSAINIVVSSPPNQDPPRLSIARSGANAVISWAAGFESFRLQRTTNLVSSPWTDVATSGNSHTAPISASAREFFRLAAP